MLLTFIASDEKQNTEPGGDLGASIQMDEPMVDLQWLLSYEMRSSMRYRRFYALAMLSCQPGEIGVSPALINKSIRSSDEIFVLGPDLMALLMSETELEDAFCALYRLLRKTNGLTALKAGITSSPRDGLAPDDLIDCAIWRLSLARNGAYGDIITSNEPPPMMRRGDGSS